MIKLLAQIFCTVVVAFIGVTALAQDSELIGDWTIVTTGFSSTGNSTSYVHLTIEEQNGQLSAYLYNGVAPIRIDGDRFEVDLDWASGFDREYLSTFRGRVNDAGNLEGELTHHGAISFLGRAWNDGKFTGTRSEPPPDLSELAPQPVDMSGIYNRASGLGAVRKLSFPVSIRSIPATASIRTGLPSIRRSFSRNTSRPRLIG